MFRPVCTTCRPTWKPGACAVAESRRSDRCERTRGCGPYCRCTSPCPPSPRRSLYTSWWVVIASTYTLHNDWTVPYCKDKFRKIQIWYNISDLASISLQVITRGGNIYRWGATTQCPMTSTTDQILTSARNSVCPNTNLVKNRIFEKNLDARNSSELDSLMDRHLSKVMLPIKVSHQMCPDSHVVAYFYYKNELISTSKHFELDECFANKVIIGCLYSITFLVCLWM